MFRSAVSAASCSSCVCWRFALFGVGDFLSCLSPIGRGRRVVFMLFVRSADALVWRCCAPRSFSPSLALPSLCRLRRRARAGAPSPYLACVCLRVWAYHLLFLCPRACGLRVWWRWCVLFGGAWLPFPGFVVSRFHTITSLRLGYPLGIPSYYSCSVPRCWRPFALCVFFGGVHIFFGVGGL